uniref:Uncharacterized protein n=1 Tax=Romanomermis culicivorax TaxID=13658 RepID=A0A915J805_ROMCU
MNPDTLLNECICQRNARNQEVAESITRSNFNYSNKISSGGQFIDSQRILSTTTSSSRKTLLKAKNKSGEKRLNVLPKNYNQYENSCPQKTDSSVHYSKSTRHSIMMPTVETWRNFMLEFDHLNTAYRISSLKFSTLKAEYENLHISFQEYKQLSENELYSKNTLFDAERSALLNRIDLLTRELSNIRQNIENSETLTEDLKILSRENEELKEVLDKNVKSIFEKEKNSAAKEKASVEEVEQLKMHIESLRNDCEKYKSDNELQTKSIHQQEDQLRRINKQQKEDEKKYQISKMKNETALDEMKFVYETKLLELQRKIDNLTSENERLKENSTKDATRMLDKVTKINELETLIEEMKLNMKKKDFEKTQSIEAERSAMKEQIEKSIKEKMNDHLKYTSEIENLRANLKITEFEKSKLMEEVKYYKSRLKKMQDAAVDRCAPNNQLKRENRQGSENKQQRSMIEIPTIQTELVSISEKLKEKEEIFKNLEQQIQCYKDEYDRLDQILKICQEKNKSIS